MARKQKGHPNGASIRVVSIFHVAAIEKTTVLSSHFLPMPGGLIRQSD
jgi:hypothetical protein